MSRLTSDYYHSFAECRHLRPELIRESVNALRGVRGLDQEVRALIRAVDLDAPDGVLVELWRAAIDGLRILYHASPVGTRRERELLLSVARNAPLVSAMCAAVSDSEEVYPTWLAVFAAAGTSASIDIFYRQRPRMSKYERLLASLESFLGANLGYSPDAASSGRPAPKSARTLTSSEFWDIVDEAARSGDTVTGLRDILEELTLSQLSAFDRHFESARRKAYRWDLWGAAYLMKGGCSDDAFADFRSDLVARGRAVFERVLQDPDNLAEDLQDIEGDETIASLASEIYEERAGKPLDIPARQRVLDSPSGEEFDFDDPLEMKRRYPRLSAQFFGT